VHSVRKEREWRDLSMRRMPLLLHYQPRRVKGRRSGFFGPLVMSCTFKSVNTGTRMTPLSSGMRCGLGRLHRPDPRIAWAEVLLGTPASPIGTSCTTRTWRLTPTSIAIA
jgi:hypothetical protein